MSSRFHVQGRVIEWRGPVVVRDETRRADADSRDEAYRIAEVLRGGGFTVWIWAVDSRTVPAALDLVERLSPTFRAEPAPRTSGRARNAVRDVTAA